MTTKSKQMKIILTTIHLFILLNLAKTYPQCPCSSVGSLSSGTNLNYIENIGILPEYLLENNLRFSHTYASQYYYHDEKVGFGDEEIVNFSLLNFYTAYGLSRNITLEADAGHFYYKSRNLCDTVSNNSFTSLNLSAKYKLFKMKETGIDLTIGLGGKIPLSEKKIESLGYSMPVTSGYGLLFKMIAGTTLLNGTLRLINFTTYDLNSIDIRDYTFGDIISNSTFIGSSFIQNTSTFIEIRNIYRRKDKNQGAVVVNSGNYYLITSLLQNFKFDTLHVGIAFDLPAYRYVSGTQLTNDFSLSINFGKSFDLRPFDPIYEEYLKYKDDFESYDDFKKQFGL